MPTARIDPIAIIHPADIASLRYANYITYVLPTDIASDMRTLSRNLMLLQKELMDEQDKSIALSREHPANFSKSESGFAGL
jgi:hypothetical protein